MLDGLRRIEDRGNPAVKKKRPSFRRKEAFVRAKVVVNVMELNRKNMKKILLIIAFAILLFLGLQNLSKVMGVAGRVFSLLTPFLFGGCAAFIMNVPLKLIENKLFAPLNSRKGKVWEKCRRPVCIFLTFLLFVGLIWLVVALVVPELVRTILSLKDVAPPFFEQVGNWLIKTAQELHIDTSFLSSLEFDFTKINWEKIAPTALNFLQNGAIGIMNAASSIFSGIFNLVLGIAFSFYILFQKEKLAGQVRRICYAYFPEERVDYALEIGGLSNKIFSNFITGQFTEAIIIGILCFAGMLIFRMPYAAMISVLVGFTALIPIFGAFIGTAVGAFLILMVNPIQAVWFVLFIIVLQQLEGNLIYPRVVGTSVGLPGIWVLVAVTLGGSLFGIVGMLVFVPISSVLYCVAKQAVAKRLKEKDVDEDKLRAAVPDEYVYKWKSKKKKQDKQQG